MIKLNIHMDFPPRAEVYSSRRMSSHYAYYSGPYLYRQISCRFSRTKIARDRPHNSYHISSGGVCMSELARSVESGVACCDQAVPVESTSTQRS